MTYSSTVREKLVCFRLRVSSLRNFRSIIIRHIYMPLVCLVETKYRAILVLFYEVSLSCQESLSSFLSSYLIGHKFL